MGCLARHALMLARASAFSGAAKTHSFVCFALKPELNGGPWPSCHVCSVGQNFPHIPVRSCQSLTTLRRLQM